MTGRWAWRGSASRSSDDPAPDARRIFRAWRQPEAVPRPRPGSHAFTANDPAQPGTDPDAAVPGPASAPAQSPAPRAEPPVPALLSRAAAWSWRLLLIGLLVYIAFRAAEDLRLVVLPCIAAMLLTALLLPVTSRLRRAGLRPLAATWCTILGVVIVLAGIGMLAANRSSADYPRLQTEVRHTAHAVQDSLAGSPFHVSRAQLQQYTNQLGHFVSQHQSSIAGTVVTGGRIVIEVLTSLVLMIFVAFFLLKDGGKIWRWVISGLPPRGHERAQRAGEAAWSAVTSYIRGTTAVAAIHAVVIGLSLWVLGVPLLVPLVILVFIAAYIPLVGILVAGFLAIGVTLGTRGWLAALVLLGIFVLENQLESHLLQPLVVGRSVRLHPLAIILVLGVGGIVAGVAGAIVAVPAAAALSRAWPHLMGRHPPPGGGGTPAPSAGTGATAATASGHEPASGALAGQEPGASGGQE